MDERGCSGVGSGGRVARVLAKSPSHRAAKNVDWGFGLESASVRERRCSGESACRSLRRWRIAHRMESVGDYISEVGVCP